MAWVAGVSFSALVKLQGKLTNYTYDFLGSLVSVLPNPNAPNAPNATDTHVPQSKPTPIKELKEYLDSQLGSLDAQAEGLADQFAAFSLKNLQKLGSYWGDSFKGLDVVQTEPKP